MNVLVMKLGTHFAEARPVGNGFTFFLRTACLFSWPQYGGDPAGS